MVSFFMFEKKKKKKKKRKQGNEGRMGVVDWAKSDKIKVYLLLRIEEE